MSNNDENVEQITKTPRNVPKREKDPKRVAAGRKLAESNRRMREEHARYKAAQAEKEAQAAETSTSRPQRLKSKATKIVMEIVDGFQNFLLLTSYHWLELD